MKPVQFAATAWLPRLKTCEQYQEANLSHVYFQVALQEELQQRGHTLEVKYGDNHKQFSTEAEDQTFLDALKAAVENLKKEGIVSLDKIYTVANQLAESALDIRPFGPSASSCLSESDPITLEGHQPEPGR